MRKATTDLTSAELFEMKTILAERLKRGRNLVYYASGTVINESYQSLQYDNIVLVDIAFKQPLKIVGKVVCVGLWSSFATKLFKEIGVRFDAFITGNDGLSEGGGLFPLNSNHSLSNILPVLKDSYLHVAFPSQYRRKWKKMFMDMPLASTLLNPEDVDYINPKIFTSMDKPGKVWRVSKKSGTQATFMHGKRTIKIQQKNIWDDYDSLDALFVRVPPCESKNLKSLYSKVECVKDFSFKQILQYCTNNKISTLGLCPWLRGDYKPFVDFIKANEKQYSYPKELNFYHLNKLDFQELYALAK